MNDDEAQVVSQDDPIDLGDGMTATVLRNTHGRVLGIYWHHPGCPAGEDIRNWIPVGEHSHYGWTLLADSPLTLAPSLLCNLCHVHGFIREGRWVPA